MLQTPNDPMPYVCVMPDAAHAQAFGDFIREGRERRRWSQEDLEAESGVSRATLSRWERGLTDRPEAAHVRAVCAALNADPRRAAVLLGYLAPEEVDSPTENLPREIREVLDILQDPAVPEAEKASWVRLLKFLHDDIRRKAG